MTERRVRPGVANGRLGAPPSKSYTHRAVMAAHYAGRTYRLENPLVADDTLATLRAVSALGTRCHRGRNAWELRPDSDGTTKTTIDCGESGTTLRFLLPAAACLDRPVRFAMGPGLRRRPLGHGLTVLRTAGARIRRASQSSGLLEIRGPIRPFDTELDTSESSQFLSGLLFAAPGLTGPSVLRRRGPIVSEPYVEATLRVLALHRIRVDRRGRRFGVPAPQRFQGARFRVPGDASSAAYLWVAAAISGGSVTVEGVSESWPQADLALLPVLERAGVRVERHLHSVTVAGRPERPLRANLDDAPDLLPLLGALASATPGRSVLRGATHATGKESDRRYETARLSRSMGAQVVVGSTCLSITGRARPTSFSYDGAPDHRMVMSAAVGALAADGPSRIRSTESVAKSYPGFWADLDRLTGGGEADP
jgi:3-phosphoshikimate 1-carboxyvinyltransferase